MLSMTESEGSDGNQSMDEKDIDKKNADNIKEFETTEKSDNKSIAKMNIPDRFEKFKHTPTTLPPKINKSKSSKTNFILVNKNMFKKLITNESKETSNISVQCDLFTEFDLPPTDNQEIVEDSKNNQILKTVPLKKKTKINFLKNYKKNSVNSSKTDEQFISIKGESKASTENNRYKNVLRSRSFMKK